MVGGWEEGLRFVGLVWLIPPVFSAAWLDLVTHSTAASSWECWGETLSSIPGLPPNGPRSTPGYIWTCSLDEDRHVICSDSTWDKNFFFDLLNNLSGSRRFLSSCSLETKCCMYIEPLQNQVLLLKKCQSYGLASLSALLKEKQKRVFCLHLRSQEHTTLSTPKTNTKWQQSKKVYPRVVCPSRVPDFCGARCPSSLEVR